MSSVSPEFRSSGGNIFLGWIKTTKDALLIFEAARKGIVPRVTRRFHDMEKRELIQSGAVLVFTEEESGIKRWTDPFQWSASRMLGNFMIYRERDDTDPGDASPYICSTIPKPRRLEDRDPELEKCIYGSWNKGRGLKVDGLMKKTISLTIDGIVYHLISYYNPSDVRSGVLRTPTVIAELSNLDISPEILLDLSQLRQPPRVEIDASGTPQYAGEQDDETQYGTDIQPDNRGLMKRNDSFSFPRPHSSQQTHHTTVPVISPPGPETPPLGADTTRYPVDSRIRIYLRFNSNPHPSRLSGASANTYSPYIRPKDRSLLHGHSKKHTLSGQLQRRGAHPASSLSQQTDVGRYSDHIANFAVQPASTSDLQSFAFGWNEASYPPLLGGAHASASPIPIDLYASPAEQPIQTELNTQFWEPAVAGDWSIYHSQQPISGLFS